MEKQYICQYCNNRFKNKNEAERHQNSLHLRKHSWSCAALTSFEDAFHSTPLNSLAALPAPGTIPQGADGQPQAYQGLHSTATDTCGYCGQEFINPPNWEERVNHLNQIHKFGECNQTKKFFRADHFRQHLKHSHAGTSGKWTNELEKACCKDEPPAQPIPGMPGVHNAVAGGQPGIIMVGQQALLAQRQLSQRREEEQAQQAQAQEAQQQAQQAVANVAQHQQAMQTTAGGEQVHFASPDTQFPGMSQVQQYQPAQQDARPEKPAHTTAQQAQSLAEHLQQAQREMSAAGAKQSQSPKMPVVLAKPEIAAANIRHEDDMQEGE